MAQSETTLLNEIRERRKFAAEIGAFAILLALFINLLSTDVSEWLKPLHPFLGYTLKFLPFVISIVFFFRYVYGKTFEQIEFNILFPLLIKFDEIKVETIRGYSPSFRANALLSPLKGNHDLRKAIIKDWVDGNLEDKGSFRKNINDLMIAMLISLIKLYSEHSLTTSSLYHKDYRHLAWKFKSYSKKVDELEESTNINPFMRMKSIKLPEKVTLSIKGVKSKESRVVHIDSPFCWMEFNVLPHWNLVTADNDSKMYKTVMRNTSRNDVELLSIPLKVIVGIKRNKIFSKIIEEYYLWMHGLMMDAVRWLSWEEYEKGDLERLVVDINQYLQEVKKELNSRKEGHSESI